MTEERVAYMSQPIEERKILIREQGNDLRKYRTEIPNIVMDMELSLYEFKLYCHLKRVAGGEGECFQSTKTMAKLCGMSYGKISESKRGLAERGLIVIHERNREQGETDVITIVDLWPQNFAHYAKSTAGEGVHVVNTPVHVAREGVHVADREEVTPIKKEPTVKKELTKKKIREATPPHANTQPIIQTYIELIGFTPARSKMAKVGMDAKDIAKRGYEPEDVRQAYDIVHAEMFWRDKVVPLSVVLEKLEKLRLTIRSRTEVNNGQTSYDSEWNPDELAYYNELIRSEKREEARAYLRSINDRERALRSVQGHGLGRER